MLIFNKNSQLSKFISEIIAYKLIEKRVKKEKNNVIKEQYLIYTISN